MVSHSYMHYPKPIFSKQFIKSLRRKFEQVDAPSDECNLGRNSRYWCQQAISNVRQEDITWVTDFVIG